MMTKIKLCFLLLTLTQLSCDEDNASVECMDKCKQTPNAGPCQAIFQRFYFDKTTMSCDTFTWGGCAGVVPFETLEECQRCGCK